MTEDTFFRGLVAALKLRGEERIRTAGGEHHERFNAVRDYLASKETARELRFIPSAVNARYPELTSALIHLQGDGLTAAPNPSYREVVLAFDSERAKRILDQFNDEDRALLMGAADAFRTAPVRDLTPAA